MPSSRLSSDFLPISSHDLNHSTSAGLGVAFDLCAGDLAYPPLFSE